MTDPTGPLAGLRILDLSRILAGPTATQYLGDLGADVIKIERPGHGDDTRTWGPPFRAAKDGDDAATSGYYLSINRNKRSVTVDVSTPDGQDVIRRLLGRCDVLVENYKVGGLAKYGLSYDDLKDSFPALVYCSITGFGQTGPSAHKAGYDVMIQGMGGIMSLTGAADGEPMKVGVAIADVMCGMHAATAILAALRHRDQTGAGQHIDIALLDSQISWLVNQAQGYLVSGETPKRHGNAHPNIVPYQVFQAADEPFILAVGNDAQFARFCDIAGHGEWAADARFTSNRARVENRDVLVGLIADVLRSRPRRAWLDDLDGAGIPCGPVNDLAAVFADDQVRHRGMRVTMADPASPTGTQDVVGNPVKFSKTPVDYRRPPPGLGEHTDEVLAELLEMTENECAALKAKGVI